MTPAQRRNRRPVTPNDVVSAAAARVSRRGVRLDAEDYGDHLAAECVVLACDAINALNAERRDAFHRAMLQGSSTARAAPDVSSTLLPGER
jgi:hypothetical protein